MKSLIYDRTQEDVNYALNNPSSTSFLKGAYNYTDLNRIEEWCEYLSTQLTSFSYPVSITTKTDWTMADFPTASQMNRIRSNVKKIKDAYYSFTSVPSNLNLMTYSKANQLEKVLAEINSLFNNMRNWFVYSGVANAGQSRVWQNRFRRYADMFNTTWNDLTETYWSDFEENETWEGAIINV